MRVVVGGRGLGRVGVLCLLVVAALSAQVRAQVLGPFPGQPLTQVRPQPAAVSAAGAAPPQTPATAPPPASLGTTPDAPTKAPAQAPTQTQAPVDPPAQPRAPAQDACIKEVFGLYCLGADVNGLLRQRPPTDQERDGERLALIYDLGQEQDYVLAFRGIVYKVVRQFRVETQLKFHEIYNQLREKYGPGEDRSLFPGYAESPASRQGSIRRGDGKAIHVWAPGETWRIELTWTREFGLSLAYVHNALEAQQRAAVQRGL